MSVEDDLVERFKSRGVVRGGLFFMPPATAVEYVRACEAADLAVTSAESFHTEGQYIYPLLELMDDFYPRGVDDWAEFRRRCNDAATAFLSGLLATPELLVNLTTLTPSEWEAS